jgi:hypothetical protein
MDDNGGGWMWFVVDVIFVAVLAFGMIYGTVMWRSRGKAGVSDRTREQATAENYRDEAKKERAQSEQHRKPAA